MKGRILVAAGIYPKPLFIANHQLLSSHPRLLIFFLVALLYYIQAVSCSFPIYLPGWQAIIERFF